MWVGLRLCRRDKLGPLGRERWGVAEDCQKTAVLQARGHHAVSVRTRVPVVFDSDSEGAEEDAPAAAAAMAARVDATPTLQAAAAGFDVSKGEQQVQEHEQLQQRQQGYEEEPGHLEWMKVG